jgi:hypothetical protein
MKTNFKIALLFFIFVLVFSACRAEKVENYENDKKLAAAAVEKYHRLYNEQKYEEIFNSAHEDARRSKSKEGLGFVLAQSMEKYGRHLGSEMVFSKVKILNEKERQIDLAYRSKFERGERIETFLIVTDGRTGALHSIGEIGEEELEELQKQ